jgi:glycosyltransferase involved in cell wall biosynthesis
MKKLLYVAPHLSTGGLPQYLTKKIELLKDEFEIYLVEWVDCTGGRLVVTRNKITKLVNPNRFFTLGENKQELIDIINQVQPDIIHLEEIPEYFMDHKIAEQIYNKDRNYIIVETSHDSSYDTTQKKFFPDKFMFVSDWQINQYKNIDIPSVLVEYPIEYIERPNREEALRILQLDTTKKHVLHVGLYTARKNQSEFFEYARQFPDVEFHSLGNQADNFKWYWEPLMNEKPANLTWWNERTDVEAFYQAMDLFLFTSHGNDKDKETMPLVIREAISNKIPTLIYNLPVYLNYFDKFDTIDYLKFNDLQYNHDKIANKLGLTESNPNAEIFIISTYPISDAITQTTLSSIEAIQATGRKVLITSHIPVPESIAKKADYVVIDNNNIITKHSYYCNYWADHSDHKVHVNLRGNNNDVYHGPSVYSNYYNGAALAKNLGYKKAFFLNYDYILKNTNYVDYISSVLNTKKAFFGKYKAHEGDTLYTYFVGIHTDFFLNTIPQISNAVDYEILYKLWGSESNGLENMWYHVFEKHKNNIHYESQEEFEHKIIQTFQHDDFSQVEYFTVLPTNVPNTFAPYIRISNSKESRTIKLSVFSNDEIVCNEEINVESKLDYHKVLPIVDNCKIQFEIFDNKSLKRIDNKILTLDNLELNGLLEIKNHTSKIKLMHLVTEPETNEKEIRSIINIKDFCDKTGIKYEQRINTIWKELPPRENCARPEVIQDKPGYYKLAPGHYGCYLAHKNAICAEDNTEYDFVLIVEGDVIVDSDYQELYDSLLRFNKISYQTDMDVIGFGNPWQNRNLNGPKIEDIYTNVTPFIPAQSYLINNIKTKKIKQLLETLPWDAIDLWMCNVAQLKIGTAEKIYTKHLPGYSIIEQTIKDASTDNPLIFTT